MDTYTEETRAWLDGRLWETSPDGVYVAHQPINGFDAAHRTWNRLARVNNAIAPVTARLLGPRAESGLLELDRVACRRLGVHRALLYVVLKDATAWSGRPRRGVTAKQIVDFRVPFHRLRA